MKTSSTRRRLHAVERWRLAPEGAAIHAGERTAVIADVHLGYEWARGAAGDCVPAHSLDETMARLSRLLDRAPVSRLIVAGDLVESPRPCRRTAVDVGRLRDWLAARGVAMLVLEGNHDRSLWRLTIGDATTLPPLPSTTVVAGWTIGHGHRPIPAPRTISGHHHPILRLEGVAAPCFLVGRDRIILPAFSPNAAGVNVLTAGLPEEWDASDLRCIATTGDELLDFGPIAQLRRMWPF